MRRIALLLALAGCTPAAAPSATDIAAFDAEQLACEQLADAGEQATACRASSRARFCARFPGIDPRCSDGGAP